MLRRRCYGGMAFHQRDLHIRSDAISEPAIGLDTKGLAQRVVRVAQAVAASTDGEAFPTTGIAALHQHGLLLAPFPVDLGGESLAVESPVALTGVLSGIGQADLALGRLYEGHVNAVALAIRYGSEANLAALRAEAEAGRIGGVWMAGESLRLQRDAEGQLVLAGRKILCSGAGFIRRPLIAAEFDDESILLLPKVLGAERIDLSGWTVRGMSGSATGTVDFEGIVVDPADRVGRPGDYLRSPYFRGGAWRVLAVQLGGVEAVMEHYRAQLRTSPHRDHPVQLARYGAAVIAAGTARLWTERAASIAEGRPDDPAAIDATVDLARNAFEAAALEVVACVEKAIGLKAFTRPNPLERAIRDLQTYLRQPALDASLLSAAAFWLGRDA